MSGYLQKPGSVGTTTTINGLSGDVTLSAGQNISLGEVGNNIEISANFTQQGKYMISGGAVWSGTGLTYDVSIISYFFNGLKSGSQATVTLAPSDPTNNRLDSIVIDEAGTISVITGTPSSSPVTPPIPEDQLEVQLVLVEAGSTQPTVLSESIYLDDPTTNWTFSTYTTGAATGSINFAGTNSPKQGTECIEASTDARLGARFVRDTSFDPYQYTMFSVWVRFTGTAVATNKTLNVRFENSAGTLVGSNVNLFSFGLSRSILNTWQLVVVPITAFGALPTTVKGLKMIMGGGTVGQVRQWDIDYMILTNGSVPQANVPTIVFAKDGTNIASQSGINLIEGTGVTISGVNNPTNNRVDYTINASGGGSPITVGTSGNTLYSSGLTGTGQGNTSTGYNIILGTNAGNNATGAYYANFLGADSGNAATNAYNSNFIGANAGQSATNASASTFIGAGAGYQATYAANSIFLGTLSGYTDTVNNPAGSNDFSILIGNNTSTGGFSNSIAIGAFATNNATNQFMVGSTTRPINTMVVKGTGGIQVPVGTTAERVAVQGMIRYNTTTSKFEGYDGSTWVDLN